MKGFLSVAFFVFSILSFCLSATASQEITPEKLAEFYPSAWEHQAAGAIGYGHLAIPGHQKASTGRYYTFGFAEFTYYEKMDGVYGKRLEKMKTRDPDHTSLEISGCQGVVFNKQRVIADIGGEIIAYFECYDCKSQEALLDRFKEIDLPGLQDLLK